MFCDQCQTHLPTNSIACYRCGRQFVFRPTQTQQKSSSAAPIILIIASIMALAGIVVISVIAVLFIANNQTQTSQSKVINPSAQKKQVEISTEDIGYCYVLEKANLKKDCHLKDCDNDASTNAGKISPESPEVRLLNTQVESANGYAWQLINANGELYYIASSKLDCKY